LVDGIAIIALGGVAQREATFSISMLRRHCSLPVAVFCNGEVKGADMTFSKFYDMGLDVNKEDPKFLSRLAKVTMNQWVPFDRFLYLDADTRPKQSVQAGFDALEAGWDMAMALSENQGEEAFWHVGDEEKRLTVLSTTGIQYQAGVMFVKKNKATHRLFHSWRREWERWCDEDQGAFARAYHRDPVRIWLLGRPWNGGSVIGHRFGVCR